MWIDMKTRTTFLGKKFLDLQNLLFVVDVDLKSAKLANVGLKNWWSIVSWLRPIIKGPTRYFKNRANFSGGNFNHSLNTYKFTRRKSNKVYF